MISLTESYTHSRLIPTFVHYLFELRHSKYHESFSMKQKFESQYKLNYYFNPDKKRCCSLFLHSSFLNLIMATFRAPSTNMGKTTTNGSDITFNQHHSPLLQLIPECISFSPQLTQMLWLLVIIPYHQLLPSIILLVSQRLSLSREAP